MSARGRIRHPFCGTSIAPFDAHGLGRPKAPAATRAAEGTLYVSHAIAMRRSKFPYVVEIAEPVPGLRKQAMYDFHVRLGIEAHPVQEHSSRQRNSRWRFASLTDAEKFARQFGGSVVTVR